MPDPRYSPYPDYGANYPILVQGRTGLGSPLLQRIQNLQSMQPVLGSRGVIGRPSTALANTPPSSPFSTRPVPVSTRNRFDWNGAINRFSDLAPYASNIVNAFRSAPMPRAPQLETATVDVGPVRLDAARADIDQAIRGAGRGVERVVSGQQAAAVNAANLATQIGAYNNVAQNEAEQNRQVRMFNAQLNQGVTARNVERMNNFQDQILARNIAQQRESSENLANAADKFMADRSRKDLLRLDKEKFDILSRMYTRGLLNRVGAGLTVPGTEETIRRNGGPIRYQSLKSVR